MANDPTLRVLVERKWRASADVTVFRLVPESGAVPSFGAGSHIRVKLHAEHCELVRHYSLTNGPLEKDALCIGVKREPASRGGSSFLHDHVDCGSFLEISKPVDGFPLHAGSEETVLLAGGIGVTPLLSMAKHLAHCDEPFRMHYFCRSREHAAFAEALTELVSSRRRISIHHGLDPMATAEVLSQALLPMKGRQIYVCGPLPFIEAAQRIGSDLEPGCLHVEKFSSDEVPASERAFFRLYTRDQGPFDVGQGDTMLDVLRRHGIRVDSACEQGVCGTCMTRVLGGVPQHHDVFLTEEERNCNRHVLPCVSRAAGDFIRLDL